MVGDVPPPRARGGLLARQRGRGHLAAGHAVDAVVHEDRGEALAACRRVDDLGGADGGEVAVALVGEHDLVGPVALDAGRDRGRAPVRRLDRVEPQVVVGEHRAADGADEQGPAADAQLLEHLGQEPVDDAVPAAGAVAGGVRQQRGPLVDRPALDADAVACSAVIARLPWCVPAGPMDTAGSVRGPRAPGGRPRPRPGWGPCRPCGRGA